MKMKPINKLLPLLLIIIVFISGCATPKGSGNTGESSSDTDKNTSAIPTENDIRDSYHLTLTLDAESKNITGSVKIKINNTSSDEWSQLCLRDYIPSIFKTLEEMEGQANGYKNEWTRVIDSGTNDKLDYVRKSEDTSIVFIKLNKTLAPGETMELQIDYASDIPENAPRFTWAEIDADKFIFEFANFYPTLAIYEDGQWQTDPFFYEGECFYSKCADYTADLTVPDGYTVAASGTEVKGHSANGMTTWKVSAKNMRDFAFTAANSMKILSGTAEGIDINCYYFDNESSQKQAEKMLETAIKSVEIFTGLFGKYPYENLDISITRDYLSGIEYPSIVRVGDYSDMLNGESEAEGLSTIREVTAHEVAHQWFYAVVGNNSYREPWLDESFASFAELISMRELESEDAMKQLIESQRGDGDKFKGIWLNQSYGDLGPYYTTNVYIRGKIFLYDLMQLMGEDEFFKMMQDYYNTSAFKEVHTQDFLNMVYKYNDAKEVKDLIDKNILIQ